MATPGEVRDHGGEWLQNARRVHIGERFDVFRAVLGGEALRVVVKQVRLDRPERHSRELLQHEFDLLSHLNLSGTARPLSLETIDGRPALVLEDAGAQNLAASLQGRPMSTGVFLDLAVPMADVVGQLHGHCIIHRDICPENFVIDGRPTLVDFEMATTMPVLGPIGPLGELEGTLAYMAPEQTGHMNRLADYRADLYSLGATFYEMLTGRVPFPLDSPIELIHAHLARSPVAPAVANPSVPPALSEIVVKLLAKTPEWRYQTAEALKADLEEARRQWHVHGDIARFELGRLDAPYGLLLEGKLYGRRRERAELLQAFERIAGGGRGLLLVTGSAGIGKSALLNEFRSMVGTRCRFLACRCDPLGREPYAPFLEAFGSLVVTLDGEPEGTQKPLRERVREAIAGNGRALTSLVPKLERLIGEQPPLPEVGPLEAENRVCQVVASFVRALASRVLPVVLVLDDLQWADPASLNVLRTLATEPSVQPVLLLVAYRTEEVGPEHPVARALRGAREGGALVQEFQLGALDADDVLALLCDALRMDPVVANPLARVTLEKTGNNPLVIRWFLDSLHRSGLLAFDAERGGGRWDLGGIAATQAAENVVDLLIPVLRGQSAEAQRMLTTAACIGSQFDLDLLAAVSDRPLTEVGAALWAPIREGLLVPVVGGPRFAWVAEAPVDLGTAPAPTLRFAHDRIQQAAYQLLDSQQRKETHLRVGRAMLSRLTPEAALEDSIFAVIDQFNLAADQLLPSERTSVARLNQLAGRRARATGAYASALWCLQGALELLPDEPWRTARNLWFRCQRDAAECAALTGDHELAERLIHAGLLHTEAVLEKAEFLDVAVVANAARGKHEEALRCGREGLRLLGVELPQDDLPGAVELEKKRTKACLAGRSPQELLDAARLEDSIEGARLRLLLDLMPTLWLLEPMLGEVVAFRAAGLTLVHGHVLDSPLAYASCALALAREGEYADAFEFGRLGVELSRRFGNPVQECRALVSFGGALNHWRAPLRESVPLLRRAFDLGVPSGELLSAAHARTSLIWLLSAAGAALSDVLAEIESLQWYCRRIAHSWLVQEILPVRQAARCLKGLTRSPLGFDDDEFDAPSFLTQASHDALAQATYYLHLLETSYMLGDVGRARDWMLAGARWFPSLWTLPQTVDLHFFASLVLASSYEGAASAEKANLLNQIRQGLGRLLVWSENAPANWRHKHDLVAAEVARLEGRSLDAMALYQQAIEGAAQQRSLRDEGLAHELCARFHLGRRETRMSSLHFDAALEGYERWGASAKVEQLWAELRAIERIQPRFAPAASPSTRPALDYVSLLDAAEAFSAELRLDPLVDKMVRICVQSSNAERVALILDDGRLALRATAHARGEVLLEHTPLETARTLPISVVEHVHRAGEVVVLRDAVQEGGFTADPYIAEHGIRSVLALPIRRGEYPMGIVYFENALATDAFNRQQVETFRVLSVEMAIAIHNGILFEERSRAEAGARLLADTSVALAESLDYVVTAKKVARLLVPSLADMCMIDLLDRGRVVPLACAHADPTTERLLEDLRARYPVDLDLPQPAALAIRSGKPLLLPELSDETVARDAEHLTRLRDLGVGSLLAIPLVARERTMGLVTLGSSQPARYGSGDLSLTQELAHRIAMAIDNARLYQEAQEAIRRRDEFLALASHELRTPVTSVQLTVQALRKGIRRPTTENLTKAIELIDRQVARLIRLMDEMLNVGTGRHRQPQLRFEPVELGALVRSVLAQFASDLEAARCPLVLHAPAPVKGLWDRVKLKQVAANLLVNAIKFGAGQPIEVTVEESGGIAHLIVRDHGIGIAPERMSRIFDRFERGVSAREYGGLGLGLYVASAIVEAHGGRIRVESSVGAGSTFTVELPSMG